MAYNISISMSPALIADLDRCVERLKANNHPAVESAHGRWGRSALVRLAIEEAFAIWLDDEPEQAEHDQGDADEPPWAGDLRAWVSAQGERAGFTTEQALGRLDCGINDKPRKAVEMEVGAVLASMGYVKRRNRRGKVRAWRWYPRS